MHQDKSLLDETLDKNDIAVCVKNRDKLVLTQNILSKKICGDMEGEQCNKGCMELYDKDSSQQWANWGSRIYPNQYVHDSYYDMSLICSDSIIITFVQKLTEKQQDAIKYYKDLALSKRELEVITWAIFGLSNAEICDKLFISKPTLRTHLNHIYQKARQRGDSIKFIPVGRLV